MSKLIVAASISSFLFGLFGVDWDSVDKKIDREFPAVEFVSTAALVQKYQGDESALPLIIDVRELEEYQVSHLQGALNLKTGDSISQLVQDKDTAIVVYCSVGYRSAGVAEELRQLGYTNVLNLRHSIFEWANEGYPMVSGAGETEKAHPFNSAWGALLDKPLHSTLLP